jgi:hypothetical protein
MKIKILKINQRLPDITGTNQKGFPYVVTQWNCDILVNGQSLQFQTVKTMEKNFLIQQGNEYEVRKDDFTNRQTGQRTISYMIEKEKKRWGASKKPSYTKKEYNDLFLYALNKCGIVVPELTQENKCKIFATYFIGAKDAGVKILDTKQSEPPQQNENDTFDDEDSIPF